MYTTDLLQSSEFADPKEHQSAILVQLLVERNLIARDKLIFDAHELFDGTLSAALALATINSVPSINPQ